MKGHFITVYYKQQNKTFRHTVHLRIYLKPMYTCLRKQKEHQGFERL